MVLRDIIDLAAFLDFAFFETETFAPFLDGDCTVLVDIAFFEERFDARLHWESWGHDWDEFVVRNVLVMRLNVEVAELPDDGVDVLLLVVVLSLGQQFFPFEVVKFTALLQLFHDLEEPIRHTLRELSHKVWGAFFELFAGPQILEMDFGIAAVLAVLVSGATFADATLAVEFT